MNERVTDRSATSQLRGYSTPRLKRWGSVAELTKVGQTNPGGDMFTGAASASQGRSGGSIINDSPNIGGGV